MNEVTKVKASIKGIIDAIFHSIDKENTLIYESAKDSKFLKQAVLAAKEGSVEDFYNSLIFPIERFTEGLLNYEVSPDDRTHFLFMNSRFIESHFQQVIRMKEGSACCTDKSISIMLALSRWLLKDVRIEFDYNAEYTYHLPKTVFTTHEDIEEFFMALYRLHYGNSKDFIELMNTRYTK
ncbi:hypothetical protein [Spartinivicinus ruber]|uniref:hypothetical protein n=1 Tax=Spartinivicinus ruber TaxID=2683272 RepID=UPI0013D25069|nr:hypothetical protein [Spartinivicinus ruber]